MVRTWSIMAVILCLLMGFAGCKSSGGSGSANRMIESPAETMAALLDQGKIDEASDVVVQHESYFAGAYGDPDIKASLDRLAGALEYKYSPVVEQVGSRIRSVQWPSSSSQWSHVSKEMNSIQQQLDDLNSIAAFKYPRYQPVNYRKALDSFDSLKRTMRADAATHFATYPLASGKSFFDQYPVKLAPQSFLEENQSIWLGAVSGFSAAQLDTFLMAYGSDLPNNAKQKMAVDYFNSQCPAGANAELKEVLAAYEKCQAAGLELDEIPGIKIAFLQVTSPDLIKEKALDFGVNIKLDMPFDASKASMRQAFSHKAVQEADILILMNVAVSKAKRVADRNEAVKSLYIDSYLKEENPEYTIVKSELEAASAQHLANKNRQTTSFMLSILDHALEENQKQEDVASSNVELETVREKLRNTPKYISVPDYQPYHVTKTHMDIYKFATVNYYVIDKRKNTYFRDTFDVRQSAFFSVCYNLKGSDPNRQKFLQTSVLEEDVVRYELEPAVVNLSDLFGQYVDSQKSWKKYASMATIHRAVVADKSSAQLKLKSDTYGFDKHYDKRFDSVVVVRNVGQGIGTGFYVTEEMVLTNYHVVGESQYVQLKLFDERETMGRVIARDARLDLALIQADVEKRPVCFYSKNAIPLGETLEAIGHPNGLDFTITRGTLSSVRQMRPLMFPESNAKVRYIQTDAAINGGNSGGPLFWGNYVVGVNDWKRIGSGGVPLEGLSFAIHYSEVFDFLKHHGVDVCKGGE